MLTNRRLIARGFHDLERSTRFLQAEELSGIRQERLDAGFALSADPDQALVSLVRLLEKNPALADVINTGGDGWEALFRLLGASEALADFLLRRPEHLDILQTDIGPEPGRVPASRLRSSLLNAVGADPLSGQPVAPMAGKDAYTALRSTYRRHLAELAVRDLCAASPVDFMPEAGRELADLAAAALEAGLAVARA